MKPKPSPHDDEIIELLKKLETLRAEYPPDLLAARRAAFIADVEAHTAVGENEQEISGQDQILELLQGLKPAVADYPSELLAARRAAFLAQVEKLKAVEAQKEEIAGQDQIIEGLQGLKPLVPDYPSDLLAARRAAFLAQLQQRKRVNGHEEIPSADQVKELLEGLQPVTTPYPPDLLAARRAAFIAEIEQRNRVPAGVPEKVLPSANGRISKLLDRLKSVEIEYPVRLWKARRSAFISQIRDGRTSVLDALRSALRNMLYGKGSTRPATMVSLLRTSMIVAGLLVAAFIGSTLYGSQQPLTGVSGPSLAPHEGSNAGPVAATDTVEAAQIICKPGYLPPLCLAKEFDQSRDLTFPGNGAARPAVAKDTIPGYSRIHKAAYVNDGLYGPGASWVSNSAYSWIKIDLGAARSINTITFGRDRLGKFNDGDPGQFVIAVALSDNVYADGNSSNDFMEYTEVYDSKEAGFDGIVSGPETVKASFDPVMARFVKITFENVGTAVDEVEVFMIQPPGFAGNPTRKPREDAPLVGFTFAPTTTLIPTNTPTRVPPSSTPVPTDTATAVPTFTLAPTDTSTPEPTDTPRPTMTHTPEPSDTPRPTRTPTPEPTNTPRPTRTRTPEPTDTPEPTNTPQPTATPQPTDTPQPPDTDTPVPTVPTDGPGPAIEPTETPMFISGP